MPRILLVTDDVPTREALIRALAALEVGADVLAAASSGDPLALSERMRPDVVLLDLELRNTDAFALAAALLGRRVAPSIVALTRDMRPDTLLRAEVAGVGAFLRIPAEAEWLAALLRALIEAPSSV